jgi:hypothetical protein
MSISYMQGGSYKTTHEWKKTTSRYKKLIRYSFSIGKKLQIEQTRNFDVALPSYTLFGPLFNIYCRRRATRSSQK